MFKRLCHALVLVSGIAVTVPVVAHHSTAMFDMGKTVEVEGIVKAYQWTNPHSYIQVVVPDGKGGQTEWSVEAGAPELGLRMGWTKQSLKPGDKVKVALAPKKDGEVGVGVLKSCTLSDGTVLYGPGYRTGPPGGGPPGGGPPGGGPPGGGPPGGSVIPQLERATPK